MFMQITTSEEQVMRTEIYAEAVTEAALDAEVAIMKAMEEYGLEVNLDAAAHAAIMQIIDKAGVPA